MKDVAKINDALKPLAKEARRHKSAKEFYYAFVSYSQGEYVFFSKLLKKEFPESAAREAEMFNPAKSQKDYVPETLTDFYKEARRVKV